MTISRHSQRANAMRTARAGGAGAPIVHPSVLAERERAMQLFQLSQQAQRIGVQFDAQAAVLAGLTVEAARAAVLGVAADSDAETHTSALHTPLTGIVTATDGGHRSAWKRGLGNPRT